MKIKDLEGKNILINDIKVKLPENIRNIANQFGNDVPEEVWLGGPMRGDWFVKVNKEDTQILPLFRSNIPYKEISEWEVIKLFKE